MPSNITKYTLATALVASMAAAAPVEKREAEPVFNPGSILKTLWKDVTHADSPAPASSSSSQLNGGIGPLGMDTKRDVQVGSDHSPYMNTWERNHAGPPAPASSAELKLEHMLQTMKSSNNNKREAEPEPKMGWETVIKTGADTLEHALQGSNNNNNNKREADPEAFNLNQIKDTIVNDVKTVGNEIKSFVRREAEPAPEAEPEAFNLSELMNDYPNAASMPPPGPEKSWNNNIMNFKRQVEVGTPQGYKPGDTKAEYPSPESPEVDNAASRDLLD